MGAGGRARKEGVDDMTLENAEYMISTNAEYT